MKTMSKSWKSLSLFALLLAFCFSSVWSPSLSTTPSASAQEATAEMAGGGGAVWTAKQVNVLLFTGSYWTPIIETMVKDARKALPPKGPRLNVKVMSPHSCEWVASQTYSQPTITFCENEAWYAGSTGLKSSHHIIQNKRAKVEVIADGDLSYDRNTACHEMMHALAWVNDNYNYNKDSCVQGSRESFGPWDVNFLAKAYQKHDTKADRKREDNRHDRDRRGNGRRGGKHGGRK
jgi:hypothetical protein